MPRAVLGTGGKDGDETRSPPYRLTESVSLIEWYRGYCHGPRRKWSMGGGRLQGRGF